MRTRSRPAVRVARRRARARGGPRGLFAPSECTECGRRAEELRNVSALLAELPRLEAGEPVAARVLDRLEVEAETRRPALAVLFRGFAAARPFMLPSLVPAGLFLVSVLAGVLALDPGPLPEVHLAPGAWGAVPASGTEGNPLFPSADVELPRETAGLDLSPEVLAGRGEGRSSSRPSWPATARWPA